MIDLPLIDLANPVRREHPLARGLVTWWLSLPGLDGGPRLFDLMAQRHGVVTQSTPTPAWSSAKPRPGRLASAVALSTSVSRVKGPDPSAGAANPYAAVSNGGDYTLTQWVRLDAFPGAYSVLGTVADNGASGYGLLSYAIAAGSVWRVYVTSASFNVSGVLAADGIWRHLTIVRAGGTLYRYANGLPVGTPAAANATATLQANGLQAGNFAPGQSNYQFQGATDDVRYYARALSPAEVGALHDDSRRGCPALLRRVPLLSRPPVVVPVLPVLPVRSLRMAAPGPRGLAARAPVPWDGTASYDPVHHLVCHS